uniref:Transposase_23 domain-containing protein n=1 Tax=Steinernema glaseri TaxID=37863 RepID=A0A1I8A8L9_9BILA
MPRSAERKWIVDEIKKVNALNKTISLKTFKIGLLKPCYGLPYTHSAYGKIGNTFSVIGVLLEHLKSPLSVAFVPTDATVRRSRKPESESKAVLKKSKWHLPSCIFPVEIKLKPEGIPSSFIKVCNREGSVKEAQICIRAQSDSKKSTCYS